MTTNLYNNKRVAKNTLYLYFRTLLIMGVTIFTSRIVLDALGVENYGIYNVVGGFVMMFSVLSGTLTAASQRFIAFELGKEKPEIKKIFSTTLTVHILLAIIVFLLLESFGIWFLNNKININPSRLTAANWVFQCSVITFCINIISIPYNAAIIAYEKISAFAYISIFEVVAKLLIVYALYIIAYDALIVYAIFMLIIALILRLIYGWYCNKNFKECRFSFTLNSKIFMEMIRFCGWNFIGSTAAVMNGQGINLLINLFYGVTFNAARGIASQVDNAINSFVQNFMMALNPQITKTYASKDYIHVNQMIILGTKYAFFLLWIICLPIFINTKYILSIWLKQVPDYVPLFVKYTIIYSLCQSLSQCLYTAMLATGQIKKYQIIVGSLSIMAFPATYIFFKLGFPAEYGYISMIIFSILCLIARIYLLNTIMPIFSIHNFIYKIIFPVIYSIFIISIIVYFVHSFINASNFMAFIIETLLISIINIGFIFLIGLNKTEQHQITNFITNKILKRQ